MKGGACIEVFTFPIKGKPEPRHATLLCLLEAWAKMEKENITDRLLNEPILSKPLQRKHLVVDTHIPTAVELDTDGAFLFGRR